MPDPVVFNHKFAILGATILVDVTIVPDGLRKIDGQALAETVADDTALVARGISRQVAFVNTGSFSSPDALNLNEVEAEV